MAKLKSMVPFWLVIALSYYFLPPLAGSPVIMEIIPVFFMAIPLICLCFSIVYGVNYSFNAVYPIFVAVLFIPVAAFLIIIPPPGMFIVAAIYGTAALAGNIIGMILFKRGVRIKNLVKYIRYFLIATAGSYVAAVIVSAFMMSRMTQITYEPNVFPNFCEEKYILNFKTNKAEHEYYHFKGGVIGFAWEPDIEKELIREENSITAAEKFKIKLICSFSLFPLWNKFYNNPWIMDGDCYRMWRTYGGRESVISGSNEYPLTYWLVVAAIKNAVK